MTAPRQKQSFRECVIRSDSLEARTPKEAILAELARHRFSDDDKFAIKLALEEAISNAIRHGNQSDPSKKVTIRFAVTPDEATVIVADEGPGFCPDSLPDCTSPERLSVPNGRGVMLMKAYMDEVSYHDNGREVRFVKRRTAR